VLVGEKVSVEAAAVVAGWEVIVQALDPAGSAFVLIAGRAYHTKWAIPAITGAVLNAEQKW
jgi:hypothetical protein